MADPKDPAFIAYCDKVRRLERTYADRILQLVGDISDKAESRYPDSLNAHVAALSGALNEVLVAVACAGCDQFGTSYDDALEALISYSTNAMAKVRAEKAREQGADA